MPDNQTPEVISEFVTAPSRREAYRVAKLAMIARGRYPDYPVHAELLCGDDWEVLFTERPLAPGASFLPLTGQRVGTTISG